MEKFNRSMRGYNPAEVNEFIDQVISHVEKMIAEMKAKDAEINKLKDYIESTANMKQKLDQYEGMERTLNKAILLAERTSDQIKSSAQREREIILEEAKQNASRIVNDALIRAEKTDAEAVMLRRNISVFKRRLRSIIEQQLDIVDDIEKVDI